MSGPIPERLTPEDATLDLFLGQLRDLIRGGFRGKLTIDCEGSGTVPGCTVQEFRRVGQLYPSRKKC